MSVIYYRGSRKPDNYRIRRSTLRVGDATKVALIVVGEITLHFGEDRVIQIFFYNRLTLMNLT